MRRGQSVTAYIILGLLLLLGVALVFTIAPEPELQIEQILYPKEIQPITNFITQCAQQEGQAALELAMSQSGWVEIPPFIRAETGAHLTQDEYGLQIIPFWTVPGEERIPPLDLIQAQLTQVVTNNTLDCLGEFSSFKDEFQINPIGKITTETILGNEDVVFRVTYPLRVTHIPTGAVFSTDVYVAFVPIRFKKMHELAKKIMVYENKEQVIENLTLSLMVMDPDIPMDGLLFECGPKNWELSDVRLRLQRSLSQNLGSVRVKNTAHEPFEMDLDVYEDLRDARVSIQEDLYEGLDVEESRHFPQYTPSDAWDYFHTYFDVGAEPTEMVVAMDYHPDYGMMMGALPNDHGVLSTKEMTGASEWLQYICVNGYHFTYDVRYPVRVGIFDPVSGFGEGKTFQFAFPVLIDDNSPSREGLSPSAFHMVEAEVPYCLDRSGDEVDIRATGYTIEGFPAQELRDVEVQMRCVNRGCILGKTEADSGIYRLKTVLPQCVNPLIRVKKEGYLPAEDFMLGKSITLPMTKLRTMNIEVEKRRYHPKTGILDPAEALLPSEEIALVLTSENPRFSQFKALPFEESLEILDDTASYSLRMILKNGGIVSGGYMAKNVTIDYQDIAGTDTMRFTVVEWAPLPTTDDAQEAMLRYVGQESYVDELKPRFD